MTRALRRARLAPFAALVVLFATMPVTVSSLLHDERDDAICNPAVVVHDAAAHGVGAPTTELPDSQHCVFCHAFQSLRAVSEAPRFAVNRLYVDKAHPLHDNDELALIPPVSGGN